MANQRFNSPRIMIVAGEASGDLHGAALAEALFKEIPSLRLIGIGGKGMRRAGVEVIFDIERLGVVGLFEVLLHFKSVFWAYRSAVDVLKRGVDLLVLIDYPDFNLRLAKEAKRLGVPVVYYISPQIWAWRAGRIKTIAERVDRMLVILPFEKEIYDAAKVPCEFVGHPLLDKTFGLRPLDKTLGSQPLDETFGSRPLDETFGSRPLDDLPAPAGAREKYLQAKGLDPSGRTVGLLPGSRRREALTLLPIMLKGMERLAREIPGLQILIPVAPSLPTSLIADRVRSSPLPIRLVEGEMAEALRASEAVVVASGTATLQAALAETPMVIVYKLSWLTYWIAKRLIRLQSIGLANIVAGAPVAPELIQGEVTPERIGREIGRLLRDPSEREKMKEGLRKVAARLGSPGASRRAAAAIRAVLETGGSLERRRRASAGERSEREGEAPSGFQPQRAGSLGTPGNAGGGGDGSRDPASEASVEGEAPSGLAGGGGDASPYNRRAG